MSVDLPSRSTLPETSRAFEFADSIQGDALEAAASAAAPATPLSAAPTASTRQSGLTNRDEDANLILMYGDVQIRHATLAAGNKPRDLQ